jgi:hypothetical protein
MSALGFAPAETERFVRRGFWITDDKRIAANIVAKDQCKSVYPLKEKPTSAGPMPGTSLPPPP